MTALGQITAGARLTAAMLRAVAPDAAYKSVDQSVTSSTTLVNDNALFLPLLASATYFFAFSIIYEGGTQGSSDIKTAWTFPSGTTMRYTPVRYNTAGTLASFPNIQTDVVASATSGAGTLRSFQGTGTVITSTTAGNLQLQWAQNTSSGTATIVHAGSSIDAWQIA